MKKTSVKEINQPAVKSENADEAKTAINNIVYMFHYLNDS